AWKYGDPLAYDLRAALAEHHGIPIDAIVAGQGIDGLLGSAVRLFIEPGTPVVMTHGGYPTFSFHVRASGGRLVEVPYRDDRADLEAMAAAAHAEDARLVYLTNPDNPMGTRWDAAAVTAFRAALPDDTMLLIDEAYVEFAPTGTAPPLALDDPGVLRFRTFSKAYGLAGLRVGYAIGAPATIAAFDLVREHFGMGRLQHAGAIAALADREHLQASIDFTADGRERIVGIASELGLAVVPSSANFVCIDLGRDGDFARAVCAELNRRGVFIRMPWVAPQDRCLRVSVGDAEALSLLARELPTVMAAL
ncbi:MAG: aminotransferase class I/II-fold pyridoxal phosphate-dependent enzyme, partial [Gaiellales bacterium]